jgi:hypothetical protein
MDGRKFNGMNGRKHWKSHSLLSSMLVPRSTPAHHVIPEQIQWQGKPFPVDECFPYEKEGVPRSDGVLDRKGGVDRGSRETEKWQNWKSVCVE